MRAMADVSMRADDRSRTDAGAIFKHRAGLKRHAFAEDDIPSEHGGGMNAGGEIHRCGFEFSDQLLKGQRGIGYADGHRRNPLRKIQRHERGGGGAFLQGGEVLGIAEEGDVALPRLANRGHAANRKAGPPSPRKNWPPKWAARSRTVNCTRTRAKTVYGFLWPGAAGLGVAGVSAAGSSLGRFLFNAVMTSGVKSYEGLL